MPVNDPPARLHIVSPPRAHTDATDPALAPASDYATLFETNLPVIKGVVRFVCHRQRLNQTEAEEFESDVMLRLVDNDYEVLKRFRHRSSLRTYLVVVIQRIFLDYRIRQWGKWRPSAEALRLGPAAVRLERLLVRDGYEFDQACETLRTNEGVNMSRDELSEIAARLPVRTRASRVDETYLDTMPQVQGRAAGQPPMTEPHAVGLRIRRALLSAARTLSDQDRLILRLRFQDGLGVADIARALNLDQRPLYRRFGSLLQGLREALEAEGIDREATLDVVSRKDVDISLALLGDRPLVTGPDTGAPSSNV